MEITKTKLNKYFTLDGEGVSFHSSNRPHGIVRNGNQEYYLAFAKGKDKILKIRRFDADQKNSFLKAMNMAEQYEARVVFAKYTGFKHEGRDLLYSECYFEKQFKDFARFLDIEKNKAIERREGVARGFLRKLGVLVLKNLKNVGVAQELKKGIAEEAFVGYEEILNEYIDDIIASGKREIGNFADIGYRHFKGTNLPQQLRNTIIENGVSKITKDAQASTASVFKTVRRIVSNSIEETTLKEGVSFTDLVEKIQEKVRDTSILRAKVIAQTELNDIANFAAMEGAINGGATHKQWVWSGIERESHAAIDGQTVPINESFDINGVEAQWPGDPNLPPEERINCGCSMIPLTLSEEEAREVEVNKGGFEKSITIAKIDDEKRIVYGIVYEPDVVDAHGDFSTAEEIEDAAHDFMIALNNRRSTGLNFMHNQPVPDSDALIVESFVFQNDGKLGNQNIKKGTWVMATKIFNDDLWGMIKQGEINGFSFQGTANAREG